MKAPKTFRWLMAIALLVTGVLAAAIIILHSESFQRYLLTQFIQVAERSTNTKIEIKGLRIQWNPLAADLSEIRASANDPDATKPLLTVSRIHVGLRLLPLLRRQVEIRDLTIDQPEIYIHTNRNGQTNLPTPTQNTSSSVAIQVAQLAIRNGLFIYDDRQIPLSAQLRGVQSRVAFDVASNSYKGEIGYETGQVQTAETSTFEHKADLQFVANQTHLTIQNLDLATLHSRLNVRGEVTNYKDPGFVGLYQGDIVGEDLRMILKNSSVPSGKMSINGRAAYQSARGQAFLDGISLDGSFQSAALTVSTGQTNLAVRDVQSAYRLEHGTLYVNRARADVLGGHLTSDANLINLSQNSGQIHYALRGASMEQLSGYFAAKSHSVIRLVGTGNIQGDAIWSRGFQTLVAHARADIQSPTGATVAANAIPVKATINVDYDARRNRASFGQSRLQTGKTELQFSGVLSRDSILDVHLQARDLHELSDLIGAIAGPDTGKNLSAYDLHGGAEFSGKVSGSVTSPAVNGQVSGTDVQLQNTKWRTLRAHVAVDSHSLALDDGSLVGSNNERVNFSARATLANWSLEPDAPIALNARVQNVSAQDLQLLTRTSYPVQGMLNGELFLTGSERHPAGRGHAELSRAVAWDEPLNALNMDFQADRQKIHINGRAQSPAGTLTVKGDYEPDSQRYQADVSTQGLKLDQIHALQVKEQSVSGQLTAEISGSGTLQDPQLTGRVQIPLLQVRGENFSEVAGDLTVRQKTGQFNLHSTVEQSSLTAKGAVELTGSFPAKITIDTGVVPIGPLLARLVPGHDQGTSGQLEVHANLSGPLKEPAQMEGHAEIRTLHVQTKDFDIASARPVNLDYRNGTVRVLNAELKGSDTDINLNGSVPVQQPGNMDVTAKGIVDLKLLQNWTGGGHSSGQVKVEMTARGKLAQPDLRGHVQIVNVAYISDALPVGIEEMNGEIAIDGNRLQVSNLSANAGGGTLTLGGSATYGNNANFNLALDAKSVRVRQNGVRAVVDASLALNGAPDNSSLNGRVTVDKLSFSQSSDIADIIGQFSNDSTVADPSQFARSLKLNIAVQSADSLKLSSNQLSIAGTASLSVAGTGASPVILGRISLTGGEVFFLSKRFEIQNGTISFANTLKTEPIVNLYATTTVEQYTITINLVGSVEQLKASYTADPGIPTADIINLLAFGQTTAEAASSGSTPASVGAESAVANAVGGRVANSVQKLTGISQLSINPLAGNNQSPGSQVAIQQRVSGNILLTFSTDVTSAQNQSIQLQYQAKKNVSVSVLRDENGGYGFDVRYHKVF